MTADDFKENTDNTDKDEDSKQWLVTQEKILQAFAEIGIRANEALKKIVSVILTVAEVYEEIFIRKKKRQRLYAPAWILKTKKTPIRPFTNVPPRRLCRPP